jgi:iron complex transport system ATP-binding protein
LAIKLAINGVTFSYGSRTALSDATIAIEAGELGGLVGPNGSGKSTLLKCINRILNPKCGTIMIEGEDIGAASLKEIARRVGYVPQSAHSIFPSTVFDAILLGRRPYVTWGISGRDKQIVLETISLLGIEDLAMRRFTELSGGERQKVLIARALAQEPQVILLDEPTSNLDIRYQLEVLEVIRKLVTEKKITAVMAVHDLNLAARYADKIICLYKGRIYNVGLPTEVITAETIRTVYGVEAVINGDSACPHIIPLAPVGTKINIT